MHCSFDCVRCHTLEFKDGRNAAADPSLSFRGSIHADAPLHRKRLYHPRSICLSISRVAAASSLVQQSVEGSRDRSREPSRDRSREPSRDCPAGSQRVRSLRGALPVFHGENGTTFLVLFSHTYVHVYSGGVLLRKIVSPPFLLGAVAVSHLDSQTNILYVRVVAAVGRYADIRKRENWPVILCKGTALSAETKIDCSPWHLRQGDGSDDWGEQTQKGLRTSLCHQRQAGIDYLSCAAALL